ncbi:hypothetical protein Avbf_10510 [Armadillidium vulgare]|nr:hypothetical protein Avbf_10510 [Armadillidium vulgare]
MYMGFYSRKDVLASKRYQTTSYIINISYLIDVYECYSRKDVFTSKRYQKTSYIIDVCGIPFYSLQNITSILNR